ncbi:MAG: methyltransferase domain-containing protein [Desulfobacterales bacterium]|jgi:SAM-dependent methyltransferase|nr:methyltransferase domain-containing protein [Desulfobacterales bacterium]
MFNMDITSPEKFATIRFQIDWKSEYARHCDCFVAQQVNFWRDIFPPRLYEKLMNKMTNESISLEFAPGKIVPPSNGRQIRKIKRRQFNDHFKPGDDVTPRFGRFYPKGMLSDIAGIFRINMEPFRLTGIDSEGLSVDLNHPLSTYDVNVTAKIQNVWGKSTERGGTANDWMESAAAGPGMQARWAGRPTDFFSDNPFTRTDEQKDTVFYENPRFVQHIDDSAMDNVSAIYAEFLTPGMKVLDLMSSWQSHIPENIDLSGVVGLGLNDQELAKNPRLTDSIVHDLNENTLMPFGNGEFDAVICTVSIEYLTKPFEVFRELGRILKPGGILIVTFSNRWFPPKAIRIWSQIHEFERVGMVTEYFLESSLFTELSTFSIRGLPRPDHDKYAKQFAFSDPIYAVTGVRVKE